MSGELKVLVVDDDRLVRVGTVKQLQANGYAADGAENAYRALQMLEEDAADVVLSDLRMPGMDGLGFLREIKGRFPDVEVILMTAYGTVETAVEAMQEGATDYLLKPFRFQELDLRLQRWRSLRETREELHALRGLLGEPVDSHGLIGRSTQHQAVFERIRSFADSEAPVLITGETGTGKELVARALHNQGRWKDGAFVPVGCGTIPKDLAESELFGHERGSFTGATHQRKGRFELADGGTLLLDDVDDLSLDLQVKLLRVLQEGTFTRVGGSREIGVRVRVLATSKVDLEKAVHEERFRPDLFYRLRGLEIRLPPLRERGQDVLILAHHFLQVAAETEGRPMPRLTPEAAEILSRYAWPGNVRELRRAMESLVILASGEEAGPEHLPDFLRQATTGPGQRFSLQLQGCQSLSFAELTGQFEAELLQWALRRSGGNQAEAAKLLGLPRTTFQSKLATQTAP